MSLTVLRFILAGVISMIAALVGLALPNLPDTPDITRGTRQLEPLTPPNQADVQSYVERLGRTEFFPAARALSQNDDPATETETSPAGEDSITGFQNPAIRALVRREAEWRLYTTGEESLVKVFEPGEELYDGWLIVEITPRSLRLERNGESQTMNVFMPGEAE